MDSPIVVRNYTDSAPGVSADCDRCALARICRAGSDAARPPPSDLVRCRRLIHRGESVYRAGDALQNLYVLRSGSVKLRATNRAGLEQIMGFPSAGALLGLDAIESGTHRCDAIALEDSLVCVLPFSEIMGRCRDDFSCAQQFHRLIAHDIDQYRRLLLTLGCMKTEQRVADFLVGMSDQMSANGYSPLAFTLKMTREDIANHLGMKVETVCRVLGRLQEAALVNVSRRQLQIRDVDALRQMSSG
ncbi:helix-turn-helix domain-containing protein [Achromobacter mucicolens]|uniref:helix-turn-helix domain-containing protein n=1 Tax=Achromobacter mucicolens TaxID=1389922 RepID=UPI003975FE24